MRNSVWTKNDFDAAFFVLITVLFVVGCALFMLSTARNGNNKLDHGPVMTAPHTWVFYHYGSDGMFYDSDSFESDLSKWLNENPAYRVTSQSGAAYDFKGRPQKYIVTTTEGIEK